MQFHNEGSPWSNWENYSTTKNWVLASGEGEHEVTCKVRDKAGNPLTNLDTIKLDETPPHTTCTLDGEMQDDEYISDVTVTLNANDNLSGVDNTQYRLDMEEWTTYTDSFVVSEEGTHTVDYYSVDNIGNIETIKTCTFTITYPPEPNLDCDGALSWTNVKPGTTVTGDFQVENVGEPESLLNWEITDWPTWGTWTFTPNSGTNLTPEDGAVTIDVEVTAPEEENTDYDGEIKITNTDNPDDYCIIEVSLATPVKQSNLYSQFIQFLQRLIEQFPILNWLFTTMMQIIQT